jgi:hypothetical protein
LFYTALNTRLDGTMDLAIIQYIYIRKATTRLKSFSYYRALNSNYSIASLLVWMDSLAIRGDVLLNFELMLGTSYLSIFGPSSAVDWVPARKLLEANGVYTAWDLVYKAIGVWAAHT